MRIFQTTGKYDRRSVNLTREGIVATIERPAVGGGWYVKDSIVVTWRKEK